MCHHHQGPFPSATIFLIACCIRYEIHSRHHPFFFFKFLPILAVLLLVQPRAVSFFSPQRGSTNQQIVNKPGGCYAVFIYTLATQLIWLHQFERLSHILTYACSPYVWLSTLKTRYNRVSRSTFSSTLLLPVRKCCSCGYKPGFQTSYVAQMLFKTNGSQLVYISV